MSENNSLADISHTSTSDTRTAKTDSRIADLLPYFRDPVENEPVRSNSRLVRYCNQNQCSFSTPTITNFRRHLQNVHGIVIQPKSSAVQVIGLEQLKNVYITAGDHTKEDLQNSIFEGVLQKDIIQRLLVQLIVLERLSFSIIEWPIFHSFIAAINSIALRFIPTSHNTIRSCILSA